jgi:hypothetical protein
MPSIYQEVARRSRANQNIPKDETEAHQHMLVPWPPSTNGCGFRNRNVDHRPQRSPHEDVDSNDVADLTVNNNSCLQTIRSEIELTRQAMERLEQTLCQRNDRPTGDVLWEWTLIAVVLDRFFFVLYVVLIALSLGLFFPRPQQNTEWNED